MMQHSYKTKYHLIGLLILYTTANNNLYTTIATNNFCGESWSTTSNNCLSSQPCPLGTSSECTTQGQQCWGDTTCDTALGHGILYNHDDPTHTRFCGISWEDASSNCSVDRHCPSGDDIDCPGSETCYLHLTQDCHYIDLLGGPELAALTFGGLPGVEDVVVREPGSIQVPQLPPAEIISQLGLTSPSPAENNNVVPPTIQSTPKIISTPEPTPFDPDRYVAANHVFCGQSHTDASERCSPETFCTDGAATHNCDKVGDYCWAGITACNAGEWKNKPDTLAPSTSPSTSPLTLAPSEGEVETYRPTPQWSPEPTESPTFDPDSVMGVPDGNYDISSNGSYTVNGNEMRLIQMSFCATNYNDLMENCATLRNCNKWQPCPSGYECYSNVKCLVPMDESWDTSSGSTAMKTDESTFPPITMAPIAEPPASWGSPILTTPTTNSPPSQPTMYTLSEDEIKQRLSYPNNYCSSSLSEIMSSCSYALHTCNADDRMCPLGTVCFENIQCPNPDETEAPVISRTETSSPTSEPIHRLTLKPIVPVTNVSSPPPTIQPTTKITTQPTMSPSVKSASPQNYCTTSVIEIQSTCTTAQTCNDGEPLCPFGMFCMKNYLCSSDDEGEATPIVPSDEKQDGSDKAVPQNYCAQWEEELVDVCTWAFTCNEGDLPCPTDTLCFPNYVCEGQTDGESDAVIVKPTPPSNAVSSPAADVTDFDTSTTQNTLDCSELCLQAIGPSDCKDVQSSVVINMNNILPCTGSTISVGHLCTGTGECDTDTELNNCGDGHDIYFRLESSKCIEHGLAVGYGVIPPPDTKGEDKTEEVSSEIKLDDHLTDVVLEDKTSSISTQAPPQQDDETAILDDESISDPSTNSDYDWDIWPTDSELESYNDNTDNDGMGSWWLIKENHASRGNPGSWKNMIAAVLTAVVLSFMA